MRMDHWHQGLVVVLGDAACCPTFYSGMGASTAVGAADLFGTLVAEHPEDLHTALGTWERVLRPEVDAFQKIGVDNRVSFTPATEKESRQRYRRMTLIRSVISNRLLAPLLRLRSFRQRQQDLTALV